MKKKQNKSYIKKLINGDISLVSAFWLWFVFISLLISNYLNISFNDYEQSQRTIYDTYFAIFIYVLTLLYTIFIFVVVIRSANKYNGSNIWKNLAKLIVSLNLFISLYSAIDIVKIFILEDYAIQNQISSYKNNLPIDIDSFTQLYDIKKEDKDIIYVYKLKNLNISTNNSFNRKSFAKRIQDSICDDEGTLGLLKKDYILKYTYLDKNNDVITKVTTKKDDCGKSIYDLDILKLILEKESSLSYNL